jgi:hypothetical protein
LDLVKLLPSALNARNSTGRTPLHFAFSLRREPLARILLEAGADPKIRDFSKNNLIHALLVESNGQFSGAEENVDKLLDLLDPAMRKDMLLQRNSYSVGARTPLHHWMHRKYGQRWISADPQKILRTVLKYSQGEELDMIDGSGDTPVHTAVSSNQKELLGIMLEMKPESIWRENAVGRTPAEVARDSWLASIVSSAPSLGTRAFQCTEEWKNPLVKRSPQSFLKGRTVRKTPVHETWELCKKHMETHPENRKLVSLNEANEVARRLTEITDKSGSATLVGQQADWKRARRGDDGATQSAEEVLDESIAWYSSASPALHAPFGS